METCDLHRDTLVIWDEKRQIVCPLCEMTEELHELEEKLETYKATKEAQVDNK